MGKRDASKVAIAETATVGVVAPGVAVAKLGMEEKAMRVATTITASEAAAVVEAEEAYRVFVVAQDAAKGEIMVATIGRRSQLWGSTITASEAAAVVEAEEAYRVFVVAQDAANGEIMVATIGRRSQLWKRQRRVEERRERTFIVGRLPLVFGLKHGPRDGDRGSGKQASDSFHLGGIASSAERLSKLTVSGDHTTPVSLDLARARASAIATAAATVRATRDDSVKRAYVKFPHKDVARISLTTAPHFF